jgi:cellulose synthase/poly-beta-1,6-N-acetylglucosamine synthase-like glycosyltransferase
LLAISIVTALILAPIVIVTAFFGIEVLAGLSPLRRSLQSTGSFRAAIVVPANDEEAVIGGTVEALKDAAGGAFALLVVADNCTDGTAQVARAAGAEVLERSDLQQRGKGFALAAARDHLRGDPPEIVFVIDADCRIGGPSLSALVNAAGATRRACQAVYLFEPDPKSPALVQISSFAFMIKNLVRQRGLQRLAQRAHLTGTGMALPWKVFDAANLGGSNIVEDLALGLELAERDAAPMLVEGATVWSPVASGPGTLVQRRRWEGGYLATAIRTAPRALGRSVARRDIRGIAAALDLSVPPLALLFVLNALAFLFALVAALVGASPWPSLIQVAVGFFAAAALVAAWSREGRRYASAGTLLRLPIYVLWKLPMYLGLARRGAPTEWLRPGR